MPRTKATFRDDFKRFFGRGLTILLPSILTLWILWYAFVFVYNSVAAPINAGVRATIVWAVPRTLPVREWPAMFVVTDAEVEELRHQDPRRKDASADTIRGAIRSQRLLAYWEDRWYLQGAGLAAAIILIYLAGVLLGGLIGRRIYERLERVVARLPGFKQVYPYVKQLVNMVVGDRPIAFKRVVLIQYPRPGVWMLGLVVGPGLRAVHEAAGKPTVNVFVPSSPTFTGLSLSVPEDEVLDVPMSVDEAIRFVLTGGALIPSHQTPHIAPLPPDARGLTERPAPEEAIRRLKQGARSGSPPRPAG